MLRYVFGWPMSRYPEFLSRRPTSHSSCWFKPSPCMPPNTAASSSMAKMMVCGTGTCCSQQVALSISAAGQRNGMAKCLGLAGLAQSATNQPGHGLHFLYRTLQLFVDSSHGRPAAESNMADCRESSVSGSHFLLSFIGIADACLPLFAASPQFRATPLNGGPLQVVTALLIPHSRCRPSSSTASLHRHFLPAHLHLWPIQHQARTPG